MNSLSSFYSGGYNPLSSFGNVGSFSGLSAQVNIGLNLSSLFGSTQSYAPQYSSSLMQSLFGGQADPLSQFFQQLSGGYGNLGSYNSYGGYDPYSALSGYGNYGGYDPYSGYGNSGGYSQYTPWSSGLGNQYFGGYGTSQNYQCPPPPPPQGQFGGNSSPCQNFQFGQNSPPHRRDFSGQNGQCNGQYGQSQTGQLQQEADGKPITYTTSGGYTVNIDGSTINITDPNGQNTVKTWGDPHESVNGTHVSDWTEKQRTIVLDDGTKLTMEAQSAKGVVEAMNIFDGNQSISIDNTANKVTNQTYNPWETRSLDQQQYDGSVAYLKTGQNGSLSFANVYTQDESFNITRDYQLLATVDANGTLTDHYDAV